MSIAKYTCKKCKLEFDSSNAELRRKGPHIGLYCPRCDAWQSWVKQDDDIINEVKREEYREQAVKSKENCITLSLDDIFG